MPALARRTARRDEGADRAHACSRRLAAWNATYAAAAGGRVRRAGAARARGGELLSRRQRPARRSPPCSSLDARPTATRRWRAWEEALADAHRRGSLFGVLGAAPVAGSALLRRGELAEAEDGAAQARRATSPAWGYARAALLYAQRLPRATSLLERGDLAGARAALDAAPPTAATDPTAARYWLTRALELLARRGARRGRRSRWPTSSQRPLRPMRRTRRSRRWRACRRRRSTGSARGDEALALGRGGARARAPLGARRPRSAARCACSARCSGEDGLDDLQEAVDVLEGSPARLELAKALAALGAALRRARRRRDAREPLRRALELASACCGAGALAEHVRTELYATGARPRTRRRSAASSR